MCCRVYALSSKIDAGAGTHYYTIIGAGLSSDTHNYGLYCLLAGLQL